MWTTGVVVKYGKGSAAHSKGTLRGRLLSEVRRCDAIELHAWLAFGFALIF
jgi:hypothetical protein